MAGSVDLFQEEELEEDEDLFFDSSDAISPECSSGAGSPAKDDISPEELFSPDFWIKEPGSVRERRDKFIRLVGFDQMSIYSSRSEFVDREKKVDDEIEQIIDRIASNSGALLGSSSSDNTFPSLSSGVTVTFDCGVLEERRSSRSLYTVGSLLSAELDELEQSFGSSSRSLRSMRQDDNALSFSKRNVGTIPNIPGKSTRIKWLKRLATIACINDRKLEKSPSSNGISERVKVHHHRKQSKEFSAVYKEQDIKGHDGAILTMKFSPDGEYLATGGEDGTVRVWRAMIRKRTNRYRKDDTSCIYFTVNHNSELAPIDRDMEKKVKHLISSNPACVVFPPSVFQLSEEPIHVFYGHESHVLDISWSNNKCLLSSSMDNTVRLWKVGSEACLKVFPHLNFVTCVDFDPVDERYFISGSIDGKVRIWEISRCRVVHWVQIGEIITSVCYHPNGKGAVVGTLSGSCRFYTASGSELQMDALISLQGKKKTPSKRIVSFQFCPGNPKLLMVTTGNLKVHILDEFNVVSKFKAPGNSTCPLSASFTADGKHIISASENSKVYIWDRTKRGITSHKHVKSTLSCECFLSTNASLAIPWHGFLNGGDTFSTTNNLIHLKTDAPLSNKVGAQSDDSTVHSTHYVSSSGSFTIRHELFAELLSKCSSTWPEEKLPSSIAASTTWRRSDYKILKSSCHNTHHAWGQVIVTAGWDGWIRSYQNYGLPVRL